MDLRLAITHLMLFYVANLRGAESMVLPTLNAWLTYDSHANELPAVNAVWGDGELSFGVTPRLMYAPGFSINPMVAGAAEFAMASGQICAIYRTIRDTVMSQDIPAAREWRLRFPREIAALEMLRNVNTRSVHQEGDEIYYVIGGGVMTLPNGLRTTSLTGDPLNG